MAIKKQSFMKGVFVIMLSQILIKLLGFIYRIVQTNIPQFADVGNSYYGSGYQVYTFILAIATMGIPNTISKLVSENCRARDLFDRTNDTIVVSHTYNNYSCYAGNNQ